MKTVVCLHCGREFELQISYNKHGRQKHIYCDDPVCQAVRNIEENKRQREAKMRYKKRLEAGTAKKYKKKETTTTKRKCRECGKPIKAYKENGAWIEDYYRCRACKIKRQKYIAEMCAAGLGWQLVRDDGDYIFYNMEGGIEWETMKWKKYF